MKTWKIYQDLLLKGEWHVHTNYTDGHNSVDDYCKKAVDLGIPLIAFTEHVRKNLDYDFSFFLDDIDEAKKNYNLIILSGCEAKVLPDGYLDVGDNILKEVDYPIFAFHSFPNDLNLYLESLHEVLKNKYVNSWAHPCSFLKKKNLELSDFQLKEIFSLMQKNDVLLEINRKYSLPSQRWIDLAKDCNVKFVYGSDVHQLDSLVLSEFP
ncbi:PHP domain-containing protein [uncultured Methanolobus sp.]|uniref:PHP domain-containing protein n=1 Tax=uncultured Methanolobus sp. TaxID=218300 RepID=UPI0029C755C5|nr:PHP domain-containing protein [uncultured Methanolobus sp.]